MSTTPNKVGSVPPETDPVTPTQPVAPVPFKGAHKVWAIVGIIALSLTFWPIGLALGITLLFVSGRRYRTVGIVGTAVGAVSMAITGMFYFLLLNVVPMALNNAAVAPIVPDTTVSAQQPTPAVVVPAPDALPTNPAASGPVQPEAATLKDLIRKIEAYRMQAFATGDISLLDRYYANHQMMEWQHDTQVIAKGKTVGNYFATITKTALVSSTDSSMVVDLTYSTKEIANGVATTYVDNFHNTYQVINNRWLLASSD